MEIALQIGTTEEEAAFARRVGVRHIVWGGPETPAGYLDLATLQQAVDFFAARGLRLGAIENVPMSFYDRVMFGLPGRDRQIDNYCRTLANMGQVGIPVLGYHWMALGGISTDQVRGRGGALERLFDLEAAHRAPAAALDWRGPWRPERPVHLPDAEVTTEQMWANLEYFLRRVLPAAEAAGVKLAAHPDDAPIGSFLGVARILSSVDDLLRLVECVPSPANGLDFCQGTVSEMPGVDVVAAIRQFGRLGKIHFAHFRDTQGTVPRFTEVFMDEGDTDMQAAFAAYREAGFAGLLRADHTPWVAGDNRHAHRGFAFEIGYMRGLAAADPAVPAAKPPAAPRLALAVNLEQDEELMLAQQLGAEMAAPHRGAAAVTPGVQNRLDRVRLPLLRAVADGPVPAADGQSHRPSQPGPRVTYTTGDWSGSAEPSRLEQALGQPEGADVVVIERPAPLPEAPDWPHQAQAFALGYLRARVQHRVAGQAAASTGDG
jgi:mannonate dehydratase